MRLHMIKEKEYMLKTLSNFAKKDLAAIMYMHYLKNVCEDDFSFDKGKTRKEIENHYKSLKLSEEELNSITSNILFSMEEGTDYDALYFRIKGLDDDFFLLVTFLIDYKGHRAGNYKGNCKWADVGMFWNEGEDCDFEDLPERHFYDIHVTYNSSKDGDGYSIFLETPIDDENKAIEYAVEHELFTENGDEKFIDYVDEIDESDYRDAMNV